MLLKPLLRRNRGRSNSRKSQGRAGDSARSARAAAVASARARFPCPTLRAPPRARRCPAATLQPCGRAKKVRKKTPPLAAGTRSPAAGSSNGLGIVAIRENRSLQISLPPSRVHAALAKISKPLINSPLDALFGPEVAPRQQPSESRPVTVLFPPRNFPEHEGFQYCACRRAAKWDTPRVGRPHLHYRCTPLGGSSPRASSFFCSGTVALH